jgi:hypothetical protein
MFDICAAPFGDGFFVSWWLVETTPSPVGAMLISGAAGFLLLYFYIEAFGVVIGWIMFLLSAFVAFAIVGSAVSQGAEWADSVVEIPGVGWIIKHWFQPVTYYRIDTTLMFQQTIHSSVLDVMDSLLETDGLRPLSEAERKPIMKDFFQR